MERELGHAYSMSAKITITRRSSSHRGIIKDVRKQPLDTCLPIWLSHAIRALKGVDTQLTEERLQYLPY